MSQIPTFNNQPSPLRQPPPKVLSNHEVDGRKTHVTYSLPGLRRATVHVPRDRWQAGGHALVGQALSDMLAELDLQAAKHSGKLTK